MKIEKQDIGSTVAIIVRLLAFISRIREAFIRIRADRSIKKKYKENKRAVKDGEIDKLNDIFMR